MIPEGKLSEWILGFLKSKTAWLGVVIATMPDWLPLVQTDLTEIVGAPVIRILGMLVVINRAITARSIPQVAGHITPRDEYEEFPP